jgi:serine protease
VGVACTGDPQCNGGTCITDLPGGYCTLDCTDSGECPSGATCFWVTEDQSLAACFKDCTNSSQCRQAEGYICDSYDTCWVPESTGDGGATDGGAHDGG